MRGRSPVAAALKARIAGDSTSNTSTSRRSWSAAVRRGGRQPRRSWTVGCSSSTKGPSSSRSKACRSSPRATALGIYDHGYVLVAERRPGHRTEGRLWHIRADRIVLATGAIERPIPFPDNDRPGIMLASAATAYLERYGVLPGRRFALATTNDSGIESASLLKDAGAELVELFDLRRGRRHRRHRGRPAPGVGRLEPEPCSVVTGRRPPPV